MKVIICGAGQVGYGIAERLSQEDNDVTVIDTSPQLIHTIQETLDVRGFVGHGAKPGVLAEAGIREADMIVAVTLYDEVNMVACQVAHSLFNVPTKVARIRAQNYLKPEYGNLFSRDHMPIDVIISPEIEVGEMVLQRMALPGALDIMRFADDQIGVIGVDIDASCPIIDTPLRQLTTLFPDLPTVITGVMRDREMFVPSSHDHILEGDTVYCVTHINQVKRTLSIMGHEEPEVNRAVIAGGGNIGSYVALALEKRHLRSRATVIEHDQKTAIHLADKLSRTVIINGSTLDEAILREADIHQADSMVALTNNDEVNILAGVMSKRLGCKQNMVLINNASYGLITKELDIDAYINPRQVTISKILQHVRRGRIRSVHSVQDGKAEIIEADALETSPLVGTPLRALDLPEGVRIGAVYRGGEVLIPNGDLRIEPDDRVVIFALSKQVSRVEKMFRVSLEFF